MVCKYTLKIKNLPKELSDVQKEDFARHFGATSVKVITSRVKEKSIVYAKFDSEELAKNVLFRLHQVNVLNCRLCVEYAQNDILQGKPKIKKIDETDISSKKSFKTFINKLTSFNDSVGFHQPPPSHLKYLYPKANRATINNIAHALATIPRFYNQVLHLMNRMNLPPPFAVEQLSVRTVTPSQQPVIKKSSKSPSAPQPETKPNAPDLETKANALDPETKLLESSSESELESDDGDYFKNKEFTPLKRKISQKKLVKRPKFIKPLIAQSPNAAAKLVEKAENVFEKVNVQVQKKIEVRVPPDSLEQRHRQEHEKTGSFGILLPLTKPSTSGKIPSPTTSTMNQENESIAITAEELAANQISHKDLGVLPVFKNYHPGAPTCRLYIKNCAKTVVVEDLEYIYNRYRLHDEITPSQFDIRLMQEGRMKGQAFVTLETIELAQKAVKETNGYILKDKPLVVVFARSTAQKT